jgi:hypothetical protein
MEQTIPKTQISTLPSHQGRKEVQETLLELSLKQKNAFEGLFSLLADQGCAVLTRKAETPSFLAFSHPPLLRRRPIRQ